MTRQKKYVALFTLLSGKEFARRMRVSGRTFRKWRQEGKIYPDGTLANIPYYDWDNPDISDPQILQHYKDIRCLEKENKNKNPALFMP